MEQPHQQVSASGIVCRNVTFHYIQRLGTVARSHAFSRTLEGEYQFSTLKVVIILA
jgi:hypothetical protein